MEGYWTRPQQKRLDRRRLIGTAVGVCTAALAGACHSGKGGGPPAASTEKNAKPRSGGQINLADRYDPETFDPSPKRNPTAAFLALTNDRLTGFKAGPDVSYSDVILQPKLAERWESPDAQVFTFHLRKGVKFANLAPVNGREFASADVKFTLEYLTRSGSLKDKKLPPAATVSMFPGLDRVESPDSSTAVVYLSRPFAPLATYVGSEFSSILAHEIFDADGDFSKRIVGTGPWQLDGGASQKGQHWLFAKNTAYFVEGRPYIDRVNRLILPDDETTNAAFQSKQIDLIDYNGLNIDIVNRMKKSVPDVVAHEFSDETGTHMYLNVTKPPLNDERLRKAIARCIDRDEFIKALSQGKGEWALASEVPGLFSQDEVKQILGKPDPGKARQLVDAAGYPNGLEFEIFYPGSNYGQDHITKLQLLQSQLKKGNINVTLKNVDPPDDAKSRRSGSFVISVTPRSSPAVPIDPDVPLYSSFYPKSVDNYGGVNDPQLTALLDAERAETDPAKRRQIIRQAVRRANEAPWALGLYHGRKYELIHAYLKDYMKNMAFQGDPIGDSWLAK